MARRAPAGVAVALVLLAGIVVSLVLLAVVVAAQDSDQVPLSYYTAGGPPPQVIIIQEPGTAEDDALDLTSIIAAGSALATGAGVIAARFKKARTSTE